MLWPSVINDKTSLYRLREQNDVARPNCFASGSTGFGRIIWFVWSLTTTPHGFWKLCHCQIASSASTISRQSCNCTDGEVLRWKLRSASWRIAVQYTYIGYEFTPKNELTLRTATIIIVANSNSDPMHIVSVDSKQRKKKQTRLKGEKSEA